MGPRSGLTGNETADELARDATLTQQRPDGLTAQLTRPLLVSIAALKAARKHALFLSWKAIWQSSPWAVRISHINPNMPNRKIAIMLACLPRQGTSMISQVYTGHIALYAFSVKN